LRFFLLGRSTCNFLPGVEKADSASIQLEGKFIDYPIVYRTRRVPETMQRIAARAE
jgi:hypothetical protein